jgi:chromosome segregation ATPase
MKKLPLIFCTLLFIALANTPVQAQRSATKKYRDFIKYQKTQIDSLNYVIAEYDSSLTESELTIINKDLSIKELDNDIEQLEGEKKNLKEELDGFYSDNLHLNQSNRILIAFNILVGVLLLVTLVFFLRRMGKNKISPPDTKPETDIKAPGKVASNVHMSFEDKLTQLEKLGMLKEKGVLTDEEFNIQKRSLLD